MTISSVSTAYLGTAMLPAVTQADAQLTQLETESTTGQFANLGLQLGDQSGYELALRNSDDLLQSLTSANSITNGTISTASDAINAINATAQTTLQTLVAWMPNSTTGANLNTTGDDALQSLINQANSTYSNQYVFGGINSSVAPMASYSQGSATQTALDDAFVSEFGFPPSSPSASTITAAQMQSFLSGAFDDQFTGANWTGTWSSASSTNTSSEIAPGQTVETSTNLNAGGFQSLTEGYAMLAMFGGTSLSGDAQQAVVSSARNLITQGMTAMTNSEAQLGVTQTQITQANSDMSNQMTLLKTQLGGLDNVNPEEIATQLNSLTTQIETAYQVTAKLQSMSLAQYLPA